MGPLRIPVFTSHPVNRIIRPARALSGGNAEGEKLAGQDLEGSVLEPRSDWQIYPGEEHAGDHSLSERSPQWNGKEQTELLEGLWLRQPHDRDLARVR